MKARIPKNPEDLKAKMVEVERQEPKVDVVQVLRGRENLVSVEKAQIEELSGNREKRRSDAKEVMRITKKAKRALNEDNLYSRNLKEYREAYRECAEKIIEEAINGKSYQDQLYKLIKEFQNESSTENFNELSRYFIEPYIKVALYGRLDEIYIEYVKHNNEEHGMFDAMMISSNELMNTIQDPLFIKNEFKHAITTGDQKIATKLRKLLRDICSTYSPLDNNFFDEVKAYTQSGKKFWREDALMYASGSRNMPKFTTMDNYFHFYDLRKHIKVSKTGTNEELLTIRKFIKEEFDKKANNQESSLTLTDIAILCERESVLDKELNMDNIEI